MVVGSLTFTKVKIGVSSNKPKKPIVFSISGVPQPQNGLEGPTPFIDRLSATLKVPDGSVGKEITSAHWSVTSDQTVFGPAKPSKGYRKAYHLKLASVADSTKWPHYQFAWAEDVLTKIRLDFIPIDLGKDGMIDLHAIVTTLMPGGWTYFIGHGRITRIDVAVDLPGVTMNDFHPLPSGCVKNVARNRKGQLQTIELGGSKGNQTVLYDRKAKRIAHKKPWKGKEGVRVERRLRMPNLWLRDLAQLQNPFGAVALIASYVPQPDFETNSGRWLQFMCTVQVLGLPSALATLPSARRTKYRAHLSSHSSDIWKPESLFARWRAYLARTNIANSHAWH
jgi:hypothetical protein